MGDLDEESTQDKLVEETKKRIMRNCTLLIPHLLMEFGKPEIFKDGQLLPDVEDVIKRSVRRKLNSFAMELRETIAIAMQEVQSSNQMLADRIDEYQRDLKKELMEHNKRLLKEGNLCSLFDPEMGRQVSVLLHLAYYEYAHRKITALAGECQEFIRRCLDIAAPFDPNAILRLLTDMMNAEFPQFLKVQITDEDKKRFSVTEELDEVEQ